MCSTKDQSIQGTFLESLRAQGVPVTVYLLNGVRLNGRIHAFDQFSLSLENGSFQVIYKRAISTVVPGSRPASPHDGQGERAAGHEREASAPKDDESKTLKLTRRKA
jgi:host factor-I protein